MRISADTYPFMHHNVYIPEDLKSMIEREIATNKNYNSISTWLKTKNTSKHHSSQAMIQVVNGRTKSPNISLLEEIRRIVTKNGLATKFPDYKQLPIIQVKEMQRLFREDPTLRWKFVSDKTGIHQTVLSNIINEKVGYRYTDAWKLTYFFMKYCDDPTYRPPLVTWDFYGWVRDRQEAERKLAMEQVHVGRKGLGRRGSYVKKK